MSRSLRVLWLLMILSKGFCQDSHIAFMNNFMKANDLTGTVVIENLQGNKKYTYDEKRSEERYLPASTFKIVNTLIALQENAVKSETEYIEWDGSDKGFPDWNKDQNILSAFPASCVWFYQELARRIGNERYVFYLGRLKYGNCKTGKKVDTFWLDGDIRISAKEQLEVIKNIYLQKYDFKKEYYAILNKVMVVDESDTYVVRAKAGWTMRVGNQIGWYVGYVETKKDVWFFACNLDIHKAGEAMFRKKIIYRAFEELGILK